MIDENALLLYKNHITTLQNTSKDTANNDSMTDSKISVYNFDNIKIKKPYISIIQDLLKEFNLI